MLSVKFNGHSDLMLVTLLRPRHCRKTLNGISLNVVEKREKKNNKPESYFGRGRCDLLNASRSLLIALTVGAAGLKKCKNKSRCFRVKSSFIKVCTSDLCSPALDFKSL